MKLKDFFLKPEFIVGLDIGTEVVKVIQIDKIEKKVCNFGIQEVLDGNVKEAILRATREADLKTKRVNISVSGPQVVIRFISFPKLEEREFKNSLRFEAEKHIPFPIEDMFLDGVILKDIEPDRTLVLIAAAKKEFIYSKCTLLKDCGLEPSLIDIDSLSLCNLFNSTLEAKEKIVSILNIGSTFSNLVILEDKTPLFSRDISIGSKLFTDKIAERLSVNFSEAQKIKHSLGESKSKEITETLQAEISNLVSEIRTSFDYYESRSGLSVEKIYITGGGSLLEGLNQILKEQLGIELGEWSLLKSLKVDKSLDLERLDRIGKQFYVALGLALR